MPSKTKSKPERDYYDILGVSHDASQEAVTAAYRKKAKATHPDLNKSPDAAEKFKAVNEAYQTLTDPLKRSSYDQLKNTDARANHNSWYTGSTSRDTQSSERKSNPDPRSGRRPNGGAKHSPKADGVSGESEVSSEARLRKAMEEIRRILSGLGKFKGRSPKTGKSNRNSQGSKRSYSSTTSSSRRPSSKSSNSGRSHSGTDSSEGNSNRNSSNARRPNRGASSSNSKSDRTPTITEIDQMIDDLGKPPEWLTYKYGPLTCSNVEKFFGELDKVVRGQEERLASGGKVRARSVRALPRRRQFRDGLAKVIEAKNGAGQHAF